MRDVAVMSCKLDELCFRLYVRMYRYFMNTSCKTYVTW